MANSNNSADEIRRQMAEIRARMHQEMSSVVTGALSATDWRSYAKSRPWLSLSIAFAAGYLVIPRRSKPIVELQSKGEAPLASSTLQVSNSPPLLTKLLMGSLGFAGPLLMRAAQGFVLREMESFLERQSRPGPPRQDRPQGPIASTTRVGNDGHKRF